MNVVTIATKGSLAGLGHFVRSFRAWGNAWPVIVYTTDLEPADVVGLDVTLRTVPAPTFPRLAGLRNAPAALKPLVILDTLDGCEECIFMDSADILFCGMLSSIRAFVASPHIYLAARPYLKERILQHDNPATREMLRPWLVAQVPYCNSGVIYVRNTPAARMAMLAWAALITTDGKRFHTDKHLVGDQEDFNVVFREAYGQSGAVLLPAWLNLRGDEGRYGCRASGGVLLDPRGDRAVVLHASGTREFPQEVIDICEGGPNGRIAQF
jgi:hypothetical protein